MLDLVSSGYFKMNIGETLWICSYWESSFTIQSSTFTYRKFSYDQISTVCFGKGCWLEYWLAIYTKPIWKSCFLLKVLAYLWKEVKMNWENSHVSLDYGWPKLWGNFSTINLCSYNCWRSTSKVLNLFAATVHDHYAKSSRIIYLQLMINLEHTNPYLYAVEGLFVVRQRREKFWTGLWPNLAIKQIVMKALKIYRGLPRGNGFIESLRTLWFYSMHGSTSRFSAE